MTQAQADQALLTAVRPLLDEHAELEVQLADPGVHADPGAARRLEFCASAHTTFAALNAMGWPPHRLGSTPALTLSVYKKSSRAAAASPRCWPK